VEKCFNQYFLHNGKLLSKERFDLPFKFDALLYEVIRVINGQPVFVDDHILRLFHSAKIKDVSKFFNTSEIKSEIDLIIKSNKNIDGNIKLEYYIEGLIMNYKVLITYDNEYIGYIVEVPQLPGCMSQGKSMDEAIENIKDAITGWLYVENLQGRSYVHEDTPMFLGEVFV